MSCGQDGNTLLKTTYDVLVTSYEETRHSATDARDDVLMMFYEQTGGTLQTAP